MGKSRGRYSGIPPFDNAALQAILSSSFVPLPAELHEEREGVTVTFLYNMRIDDPSRAPTPLPASVAASSARPSGAEIRLPPPRPGTAAGFESVSLDQPDFKHPAYIEKLVQIISSNWFKPIQAPETSPVVHFQVERDGTITNPRIIASSGAVFIDRAALRAVYASSPVPPLPAEFGGSHIGIQVVFE